MAAMADLSSARTDQPREGRVKCVVWDLDNTVWDGVLLEDGRVTTRPEVVSVIHELDRRGILHSIASRNDPQAALEQLTRTGLRDYFLCPQINWNPKSSSIEAISRALNIGVDAVAFVDDQPFELEEVAHSHAGVLCVHAGSLGDILEAPEFTPRFVTAESATRRFMYQGAVRRDEAERELVGTNEEFLSKLDMVFTITEAEEEDLWRAEELTVRTNQLNSTGVTYAYEDLRRFVGASDHLLLMASLRDTFGGYGKIGMALIELGESVWTVKLLLMSCRVMSRGVGTVLLNHVMRAAGARGVALRAEFVPTDRNRVMYVTYRFAGFREVGSVDGVSILEADLAQVQDPPTYLRIEIR
jgi:FkbH-like protein